MPPDRAAFFCRERNSEAGLITQLLRLAPQLVAPSLTIDTMLTRASEAVVKGVGTHGTLVVPDMEEPESALSQRPWPTASTRSTASRPPRTATSRSSTSSTRLPTTSCTTRSCTTRRCTAGRCRARLTTRRPPLLARTRRSRHLHRLCQKPPARRASPIWLTSFEGLAAIEKSHENRYQLLIERIENDEVFRRKEVKVWVHRVRPHRDRHRAPGRSAPSASTRKATSGDQAPRTLDSVVADATIGLMRLSRHCPWLLTAPRKLIFGRTWVFRANKASRGMVQPSFKCGTERPGQGNSQSAQRPEREGKRNDAGKPSRQTGFSFAREAARSSCGKLGRGASWTPFKRPYRSG